jgi:hypothetical protein
MKEIDIFNYNDADVKDCSYNVPVKLVIRKTSYEAAKKTHKIHKNRSTIGFHNVAFNSEVSLNVDEGIDQDISIDFFRCFIDSFSPFALESKNVSLYFGGCLVDNFVARDVDLKSVKFNNCFGTYFLINLKTCDISYTEENIFIREWLQLLSISRFDSLDKILSYKTSFHITDVEKINFYGNEIDDERRSELLTDSNHFYLDRNPINTLRKKMLLSKEQKLNLNLSINLTYKAEYVHQKTTVRNLMLNALSLNGKTDGELVIEDCKIDNVFIRNFSPKARFTLYNIETRGLDKGKFEVHNSNLDNTSFNAVRLNKYFIVFFKSSFINTTFYSTIFPSTKQLLNSNTLSSIENIHYPDKKSEKRSYNRDMYELFLELKQTLEKRGNVFEAQKMKAVAQDFLIKIESNNVLKSDFWNNKFILLLNRASNFHGLSVRNAFWWIIVFALFFHWLNVLSFKSYSLGFNSWDEMWGIFNQTKRYVFAIANPAHRVSSLAPVSEITGYTYAFSFLSRIVVGYLYYQFVAAFRRFGK